MDRSRIEIVVLVVGTALFGSAMAARGAVNPWWTSAAAAALVLVASGGLLRGQAATLFKARTSTLALAVALAAAMVVATHLCFALATSLIPGLHETVALLYREIEEQSPGKTISVLLVCLIVVAEELLWRGVAVQLCAPHWGRFRTGILVVGLYALPQILAGTWVLVAVAVAAGTVFTTQRLLSGGLVSSLVTHAIWSSCVFSLLPLA